MDEPRIITGRDGFDIVSMDDYSHDMEESAERASAIIRQLRKERDEALDMVARVVMAAGGCVQVRRELYAPGDLALETEYVPSTGAVALHAKPK